MAAMNPGISRDLVIHPGETIADILESRNLSQKELAQRAGVSEAFLSDVIHGKKDISKSLAMGLEYALGVPSSFWLNLQSNYDAELLALQAEDTATYEEKNILQALREFVDYLKAIGRISDSLSWKQQIIQLRRIFQISDLTRLGTLVPAGEFRIAEKATVDPYVLGAWVSYCKSLGNIKHLTTEFSKESLPELIASIKQIMCNGPKDPQKALMELFAKHGVDFSVMRNFRGAPVHGYIRKKDDGTYQMVVTIRGSYADIFWFSLFHELGHIANGDVEKVGVFVDAAESKNAKRETAANTFAGNALLDEEHYRAFVENTHSYTYQVINDFAKTQDVPAYIVIGRLQKDGHIPWDWFARYKLRYKWAQ